MTESLIKDSMARGPQLNRTEAYEPAKETACALADPTPHPSSNRSKLEIVELDFRLCCRNVARIGLQAAEALAYAHSRGVVHRDIKPSNLLLDTAGIVWATDFGLAKTQDHALTETGDIVGTVRHMAPERFRGECDARSDVYSLGVTLYELLTLKPAFDNTDRLKLIESIGKSEPVKPRSIESQIPRDIETIVLKAIDKDPRGRYATADAMAADLRRYLNDEPIQARRIGPAERAWRWVRRNPVVTALMVAVVGIGLLGHLGVVNEKQRVQAQRDEARSARDELRSTLYASQLNLVQSAFEADNVARALDILDQQRPKDGEPDLRGFEWHYWRRQCFGDARSVTPQLPDERAWSDRLFFTPDGHRLIAAPALTLLSPAALTPGYFLRAYDAMTGQSQFSVQIATETDGSPSFAEPAVSPDGRFVATDELEGILPGHMTTKVVIRALEGPDAGREVRTFPVVGITGPPAFTSDGRQLAAVVRATATEPRSGKLVFWDVATGQEKLSINIGEGAVQRPVFSPNGIHVALVDRQETHPDTWMGSIKVWDVTTQQVVCTFDTRFSVFGRRTYSPDGRWLAGINPDGAEVVIWDATSGHEYRRLRFGKPTVERPDDPAFSFLTFSPDSRRVAVAWRWSPTVQVWDVQSGRLVRTLKGHTKEILGIAFHRESGQLLTVSRDRTIRIWSLPPADNASGNRPDLYYEASTHDGRLIAANEPRYGKSPAIVIQDGATGKTVRRVDLAAISADTPASLTIRHVDHWTFSSDGRYLVVPADDRKLRQTVLRILDVASGEVERTIPIDRNIAAPIRLEICTDSRRLAGQWQEPPVNGQSRRAKDAVTRHVVWEFASGRKLLDVTVVLSGGVFALSHDGKLLALPTIVNGKSVVRLWDVDSGRELREIATGAIVTALAFGPSAHGLLVMARGSGDGNSVSTGTAYDTATGEVLTTVRGVFGNARRIAFSPDGKRLAISFVVHETQPEEVRVWDMVSQRELMTLRLPELYPRALHFTPDGHKLIFLGGRTGVHVWDGTPLPE